MSRALNMLICVLIYRSYRCITGITLVPAYSSAHVDCFFSYQKETGGGGTVSCGRTGSVS